MLNAVAYPRAINPSKELLEKIRTTPSLKNKAEIYIERKDVIYKINSEVETV